MADLNLFKKSSKNNIAARFSQFQEPNNVGLPQPATQTLPPIGVFWDIENCSVPKGKSAAALVLLIREKFFTNHREAEFLCVCDINKEPKDVIHELNLSQVTVIHINATSKNAADEKLKQCMHRFADTYPPPATIILISGDVNFAPHLSDYRHRQNLRIILIHGYQAPEALIVCAHENYNFYELTKNLPLKGLAKPIKSQDCILVVRNLPRGKDSYQIHNRLKQLSDNCGGKVTMKENGLAQLKFPNPQLAQRAQKRMDNEDVFGTKISVNFPIQKDMGQPSHPKGSQNTRNHYSSGSSRDSSPSNVGFCVVASPHRNRYRNRRKTSPGSTLSNNDAYDETLCSSVTSSNVASQSSTFGSSAPFNEFKKPKTNKCIGRVSPFVKSVDNSHDFSGNSLHRLDSRIRISSPVHFHTNYSYSSQQSLDHSRHHSYDTQSNLSQSLTEVTAAALSSPVELLVTNLDQSLEANVMKKILLSIFREHIMVLHISMNLQPDSSLKALIKVPSIQDAQYAISQLHRRKIGCKRILISYLSDRSPPLHVLRCEVVALLSDIPSTCIPLFKFRELFEQRYHRSLSVSDLYKMKESVLIKEEPMGRLVYLNPDYRPTPSPIDLDIGGESNLLLEKPYCELHYETSSSQAWAEQESVYPLPDVVISLKTFAPQVHYLLDGHQGSLPLNSFCSCYKHAFKTLPLEKESSAESKDDKGGNIKKGVPLEHLIACIPGVQISKSNLGIKKILWLENKEFDPRTGIRSISPALQGQLTLFCREVVDLIKSYPGSLIPFNKFIPDYHHHFGRQCRVADYGFTKLLDLMEALPHLVQILGQSQNRILTLTHKTQIKRFATDLMRILKSRSSKQLLLEEIPNLYRQCIGKPFHINDYGVCDVHDMVKEMSDNMLVVAKVDKDTMVSLPKREQTAEEMEKTLQFSKEVVELLRHTPICSMSFSKFIPAYHHHYNKQCKVAEFGFSKLIELFEAIPHVIEVTGIGDEKAIHLKQELSMKILSERIVEVIKLSPLNNNRVSLKKLAALYSEKFGHILKPEDFNSSSLTELLSKLKVVKVVATGDEPAVTLVDKDSMDQLSYQVQKILFAAPEGKLDFYVLSDQYKEKTGMCLDPSDLQKVDLVTHAKDQTVELIPTQKLLRKLIILLKEHNGQILFSNLDGAFHSKFQEKLKPSQFGFPSVLSLLQSMGEFFNIKGRRTKRYLLLNKRSDNETEVDIKPEICQSPDLIRFESPLPVINNLLPSLSEQEKAQIRSPPICQGFDPLLQTLVLGTSSPPSVTLPIATFGPQYAPTSPVALFVTPSFGTLSSHSIQAMTTPLSQVGMQGQSENMVVRAVSSFSGLPSPRFSSVTSNFKADSCEDLTSKNTTDKIFPSTHSSPTRGPSRRGSRIAAQFSIPLNCQN